MRLWNDYEGSTIAEVYPIEKLLRPEGRSAFFSTSNGTGTPAVIRLIESLNDEYEILPRWKVMAELKQTHLVTLKKYGQTTFEGTPLLYAVMESTDADLAQILGERSLSVDETRQLATSLVEALETLHGAGFVHEHIEPSNVLAKGEIIKLRSDCVREAPEGDEGIALKQRDIHDLAVVLLRALTLRKDLPSTALPPPFDKIIRNGINGTWGLAQIAGALAPPPTIRTSSPTAAKPMPAFSDSSDQLPLKIPETQAAPRVSTTAKVVETAPLRMTSKPVAEETRINLPIKSELARQRLWLMLAGAAVVLLAVLGWRSMHKATNSGEATARITTMADTQPPAVQQSAAVAPTSAPVSVAPTSPSTSQSKSGIPPVAVPDVQRPWRMVAYTYNHQDQAQHKADQLAQRNPSLQPKVFSPNGHAPYLVTLGGAMSRDEAVAYKARTSNTGLPKDAYIQNYTGRSR